MFTTCDASGEAAQLFMQKHWDVMRSNDAGDLWHEVSGNLPTDFGFAVTFMRTNRKRFLWCRLRAIGMHYPPDGQLRVYRAKTGGNEWEALGKGCRAKDCYVNVCAMRWRWIRWTIAAFILGRQVGRFMFRRTRGTLVARSCGSAGGVSVEVQTLRDSSGVASAFAEFGQGCRRSYVEVSGR